jgi:hypothetical protein
MLDLDVLFSRVKQRYFAKGFYNIEYRDYTEEGDLDEIFQNFF